MQRRSATWRLDGELWRRIFILCLLAAFTSGCGSLERRSLKITVLYVGQGDGIVMETPGGHTCIIDAGPRNPEDDAGERVVVPFLRREGINHIDILLLTHPHEDHVGGMPAIMAHDAVGTIMDGTVIPLQTEDYEDFLRVAHTKNIPIERAVAGEHVDFHDGVTMDILSPPPSGLPFGVATDSNTINNYSAVARVSFGKTVILLDGDAEAEAEERILSLYPASYLRCDVLKCGHHGSRNASTSAWLAVTQPRYAVISCGRHNIFGHPNVECLQRLQAAHAQIYRTDQDGAVTIESDGKNVDVTSEIVPDK